jgi:hypothetical protein
MPGQRRVEHDQVGWATDSQPLVGYAERGGRVNRDHFDEPAQRRVARHLRCTSTNAACNGSP